jgi:hypothetical protein
MEQRPGPPSWWHTLPGILTALAGIITAVAGLLVALNQTGAFERGPKEPAEATETRAPLEQQPARTPGVPAADVPPPSSPAAQRSRTINLLAPESGGHLVVAASDDWQGTIDGKENQFQLSYGIGKEAVFAFKDERTASFDSFAMLINGTEDWNIKEFELLINQESFSGPFDSIGKFQTQNLKIFATPYQLFKFQPVTAKYLKFRLISTYGWPHPNAFEFQLFGTLQ